MLALVFFSRSETTLYAFTGGNDGGQVFAGVTLDPAGNIFGAAAYYGTVVMEP